MEGADIFRNSVQSEFHRRSIDMKATSIKLVASLVALSLALSACGVPKVGGGGQEVSTSPSAGQATVAATATGTGPYFEETFSSDLKGWSQFLINGSKDIAQLTDASFGTMTVGVSDGFLVFDLQSKGQWAYAIYDAQEYDDVRLDVTAENRLYNDGHFSLLCRYTPDGGWYEYNITNSGLYTLYYGSVRADKVAIYRKLANGGYSKFKVGKDTTNDVGISCVGRTISLFINGVMVKAYEDNSVVLKSGKVGLGVSSYTKPALLGFDSAKTTEPKQ
jgi:3-keto-disaccharide hydrolase